MIENEIQYKVTQDHARRFRRTLMILFNLQLHDYRIDRAIELEALESMLDELDAEIKVWENKSKAE